jgi:hypothetical protein
VPGASNPLQCYSDGPGGADLNHEVHAADVDAQLERRSGHDRPQVSGFEPRFRIESQGSRKAAVVRQNDVFAQPFGQRVCDTFRKPACVDEDERSPIVRDVGCDPVVDLRPHFAGCDRAEFIVRHFDRQIHLPAVADVDDRCAGREVICDGFDGAHGGGESNPLRFRSTGSSG